MHIINEVQKLMLYTTHLLPKAYFLTKNELFAVNIMEVIEQTPL